MAPFEFIREARHPYVETSVKTHGHFAPTPIRYPSYAAAALPFLWMRTDAVEQHLKQFDIDYDPNREPKLPFESGWVQEHRNQRALLDCFFEQVRPEESLCFFYAKQVLFIEDAGRVRIIVGVGRVKHIGEAVEYKYNQPGDLRSILWERMVQHSIRPDFKDGFLLPYHQALEFAKQNPDFDPAEIAAFAPGDRIDEFSYATEHVTHDGAIAALLTCAASLHKSIHHHIPEGFFPKTIELKELHNGDRAYQLTRLAEMGNLIRSRINKRIKGNRHQINVNWRSLLDQHLNQPLETIADSQARQEEGQARQEKAAALKELAESRFSVSIGQAGTGKTTLLSVLCNQKDIAAGEVLLLAPTGKASVRMETSTKIKAYTGLGNLRTENKESKRF